ncbi:MAG: triose-phosphate isomerase [Spirochaetales bacterium]|nr:triose-phosphate isomerase [Spirochaetales bacterium]
MKRIKFIAGNWKLWGTLSQAKDLAKALAPALSKAPYRYLVAPPYTALAAVKEVLQGTKVLLGAQDCSALESGARTGEVSVLMLKELGVDAIILGHSERRQFHGETDQLVNEKIKLALKHGFEVIYCNGETLAEREAGQAAAVVVRQTKEALKDISEADLSKVTIAYEPVWAIGTGKTATPRDANEIHAVIRKTIADIYSKQAADAMIIQYGGSVKPDNVRELMAMPDIDGALVGGASLKSETFLPICLFDQ